MSASPTDIVMIGAYGDMNFGDDALMVIVHRILASALPEAAIRIMTVSEAKYINELLPRAKVARYDRPTSADLAVRGGGTQFYSYPLPRALRHSPLPVAIIRALLSPRRIVKRLRQHMVSRRQEKLTARHSAALAVGVGPFVSGSREESTARALLSGADFLAVRDEDSLGVCRQWNVGNALLGADLLYAAEDYGVFVPSGDTPIRDKQVVIVVQDWYWTKEGEAVKDSLLALGRLLEERGYAVHYLSFCGRDDKDWVALLRTLGKPLSVWNANQCTFAKWIDLLATAEVVVTCRYHGAVAASLVGRPSILVDLSQKHGSAAKALSRGKLIWRSPFEPRAALDLVETAARGRDRYGAMAAKAAARQGRLARAMIETFYRYFRSVQESACLAG